YIEREDFMENPPPKYHRLFPGNEVRLKDAYFIRCEEVVKNEAGEIVELRCTYDPATKSGSGFTARKVKSTIHWVEASHAVPAEFRLYEPLILDGNSGDANNEEPEGEAGEAADAAASFPGRINPKSLEVLHGFVEPGLKDAKPHDKFQFSRHGYFNVDPRDSGAGRLVFNRIVSLKSSYELPVDAR